VQQLLGVRINNLAHELASPPESLIVSCSLLVVSCN